MNDLPSNINGSKSDGNVVLGEDYHLKVSGVCGIDELDWDISVELHPYICKTRT